MRTAWRLVHQNYLSSAFSGEGARLAGGRWNSGGGPVVYTAGSLSLAVLEIIVHLEFKEILSLYKAIPISIPEAMLEAVDPVSLPSGWNKSVPDASTLLTGSHWIRSQSSVALQVPSAIVPIESNILINPAHPKFQRLEVGEPMELPLDLRVLNKLK